ncbi:septum formation initiator family protein [Actibacterium sp. 188UL27-1]|uniref:FtsB family cell division protein n=1 Tax=Actibacterium sp. 188UL27-1 TaxID=2786961 RepID=UPI001959944B|nr:septum formation initiator family protein [Actibacterium sp. 188UL27-1]MBM7068017.1 septum formation initiator family protein [Actibacterium sp. 188UL27-1]
MSRSEKRPALAVVLYFAVTFSLAMYFTFAAVQGDFGLFRRVEINAELVELRAERARLLAQVRDMRNKTHRLSDDYLDLDLLDQQARDVLGLVRSDELVFR